MSTGTLWPLYLSLLVATFLLIGAELYVPGGVLGVLGALCLVGAVVVGFRMGPTIGWAGLAGLSVLVLLGIIFWMRIFPRSRAGRRLTLEKSGGDFKTGRPEFEALSGKTGTAQSDLRPAGAALVDGHRVDVIAEDGRWIPSGARVRVIRVSGSRIYVEPVENAT